MSVLSSLANYRLLLASVCYILAGQAFAVAEAERLSAGIWMHEPSVDRQLRYGCKEA
jgi:hypothetical protein